MVEIIIGAVLPPFVDLINRHIPNSNLRYVIALIVSILVGTALNIGLFQVARDNLLESISLVFVSSQSVYKLYWDKSTLRERFNLDGS